MANHIEFRQVHVREDDATVSVKWQYRTKDIVASVLGAIPLTGSWSAWTDVDVVQVDQVGNPL